MLKNYFLSLSESRIVAALLVIHVLLAVASLRQTSLTWDEPSYIGVGRQMLEARNPDIKALQLHPPLSYYLNSLCLLPLRFEPDRFSQEQYMHERYIGPELVFDSGHAPDLVIFLSRIPFVLLSAFLGWIVYRWSRKIYGPAAGVLSAFFYSLCPTVLAHCRLATADLLLALTMTLALYLFHKYLETGSARHVVLSGIALGLALLSKFTGLILLPTFCLLVLLDWWRTGKDSLEKTPKRRRAPGLFLIFGIAVVVVWMGYGFQFSVPFIPGWLKPEAERLIAKKPFWHAVDWLANRNVRIPAYSYLLGVYTQLAAAKGWKDNFLFGQISSQGWWYFYWTAFLIKTPIAFIITCAVALGMRETPRRRGETFLLISMIPMIIIFSLPTKINIGIRYILPLFPLLCILAGKVANIESVKWKRLLVVLCIWYAGSTLWIHPRYLAYFNEFTGGPGNGYKYLVDSNLDWGQSLHELSGYVRSDDITDAKIKYFGPPGVMKYYGLENSRLENCGPSAGIWAVSATYLQNLYLDDRHCHDWLRKLEPKEVLGHSIFIYDVSENDLAIQAR